MLVSVHHNYECARVLAKIVVVPYVASITGSPLGGSCSKPTALVNRQDQQWGLSYFGSTLNVWLLNRLR